MLMPKGPRVLVKRIDQPKPQSALIVIPDTIEGDTSLWAIVLAVGNKVTEDLAPGMVVILTRHCGTELTTMLGDEKIDALLVMESDILAVDEDASAA